MNIHIKVLLFRQFLNTFLYRDLPIFSNPNVIIMIIHCMHTILENMGSFLFRIYDPVVYRNIVLCIIALCREPSTRHLDR